MAFSQLILCVVTVSFRLLPSLFFQPVSCRIVGIPHSFPVLYGSGQAVHPVIGVGVLIRFSALFRAVPVPVISVTEVQQYLSLCRHGHKAGRTSVFLIVILRLQAVSVTQRLKGSAFVVVIRSQHVLRSFRYLRQTVQRVIGVADRSSRAVGQAGQVAVAYSEQQNLYSSASSCNGKYAMNLPSVSFPSQPHGHPPSS